MEHPSRPAASVTPPSWAYCAFEQDDGGGDAAVVRDGEVGPGNSKISGSQCDITGQPECRLTRCQCDNFDVAPWQVATAECLGECFLGGETTGNRLDRSAYFGGSEQSRSEARCSL